MPPMAANQTTPTRHDVIYMAAILILLALPTTSFDPSIPLRVGTINKREIVLPDLDLSASSHDASGSIPDIIQAKERGDSFQHPMIMNGHRASLEQYPFMVSIQRVEENLRRRHICAGVLIATNKALTAAHCLEKFPNTDHYVALGFRKLSSLGQALLKIKDAIWHPIFKSSVTGIPNDLAVILFETHVELTSVVQIASLTTYNDTMVEKMVCSVVGWGMSEENSQEDDLRHSHLMAITNYDCSTFFRYFGKTGLKWSHLCAWNWPQTSCYGDSGGPLVCAGKVAGIDSWGVDCTGCFPDVFTRLSAFHGWIEDVLKQE